MSKRRDARTDGRSIEADAKAMLEGHGRPDARRLFTLIHDVNPTGRELPIAVEQTRYALKSRLQSLLIKHFRDDLTVGVDPDHPGYAVIRHRHLGLDACHAALDTLDDQARSWARFELDVAAHDASLSPEKDAHGEPADRSRSTPMRETATEPLVQRGHDALDAYDYDSALACFDEGLTHTGGGYAAALPLLELLVDLLAANDQALAVEARLHPACRVMPEIRALLALAAARAGQRERSAALLEGASSARVTDVLAALTESALRDDATDEAVQWLAALVERAPGHGDRDRFEQAVAKLRSRELAPAEEALARLIETENLDAMEAQAKRILARWPASEVARRAMRTVREALRQREIVEEASLARAMAERAAIEDARKIEQTVEALRAKDPAPGLRLYVALAGPLRTQVRVQAGSANESLDWIERVEGSTARLSDKDVVAAVVALHRGRALASSGDHSAALTQLAEHDAALRHLGAARELAATCRHEIATRRRAQALAELDAARKAVAAHEDDSARRLLATIGRVHLDAAALEEAVRMDAEIASRTRVREANEHFDIRVAEGDTLGARNEADKLVELTAGDDRKAWIERRDALTAQVRADWHICDIDGASDLQELGDLSLEIDREEVSPCWLLRGGREMVVASVFEQWVFVRLVDRVEGRVLRRGVLKAPTPFYLHELSVMPSGVWLAGADIVLHLAADTWEVLRWWDLTKMIDVDDRIEDVNLAPGARYAWLSLDGQRGGMRTRVIDLERLRMQRDLHAIYAPHAMRGSDEVAMICRNLEKGGRLFTAGGTSSGLDRCPDDQNLRSIALHPTQPGFVALTADEPADDDSMVSHLNIFVSDRSGLWTHRAVLPDATPDGANTLATSHNAGVTATVVSASDGGASLVILAPLSDGFTVARRMALEAPVLLAQDAAADHVVAIYPTEEGIDSVVIDADTAALPGIRGRLWGRPRSFMAPYSCGDQVGGDEFPDLLSRAPDEGDPDRRFLARTLREQHASDPRRLISLGITLKNFHAYAALRETSEFAYARFPDHPSIATLRAGAAANAGEWAVVLDTLRGVPDDALNPFAQSHRDHLMGLALLHAGDADEAHRVFRRSVDVAMLCPLAECLDLADVARSWGSPTETASAGSVTDRSHGARILDAIQRADRALAGNDPHGALDALHRPIVLGGRERQSLGRLATAHLAITPTSGAEWFQKALALGIFCGAHPLRPFDTTDLPVPHGRWDDARFDRIVVDAQAWLERETATESGTQWRAGWHGHARAV